MPKSKQPATILERNYGGMKNIGNIIKATTTTRVMVGIPSDAPDYPDGTDVAMVATIHEYGSEEHKIVPKRFIRGTIEDNRSDYIEFMKNEAIMILDKKSTINHSLFLVGELVRGDIQMKIRNDHWERWAYERKGGRRVYKENDEGKRYRETGPLIDTGHLRNSITYRIEPSSKFRK